MAQLKLDRVPSLASMRMRVLQIHNRYRQQGGEDQVVAAEADLLAAHGFDVHQHLADNPKGPSASARGLLQAPWNRGSAQAVADVVRTYRPDLVHIHNTWFQLSPAVIAAAHQQVPVVMTVHNYRLACSNGQLLRDGAPCRLCIDGNLWNGVLHSCYRNPVSSGLAALTIRNGRSRVWNSQVDLFLALSDFAAEILSEVGVPRGRISVKDNFVADPGPRLQPAVSSRELVFVGRLSPEKGVAQLVEHRRVFAEVGLSLKVIGDGPLRADIASALGSSYLGQMSSSDLAGEMLKSRALLMPSIWYEGQPRTALEAFAAGLPVMGSSIGAVGELLRAQPGSWTFDPHREWQRAADLLASDETVAAGSAAARALWLDRFQPATAIASLAKAYERAVTEHSRHG